MAQNPNWQTGVPGQQPPLYSKDSPQQYAPQPAKPAVVTTPIPAPPPPSTPITTGIRVTNLQSLEVITWGSLANVKVSLNWRVETPSVIPITQSRQFTADNVNTLGGSGINVSLGNGTLTSVSLSIQAGSPLRGQLYARVRVMESASALGTGTAVVNPGIKLISGYLCVGRELAWPPVIDEDPLSGHGLVYNTRGSALALVAAGLAFGPPARRRWRIMHINLKLVTSATAGSRLILVYMTDGTTAPVSGTEGANALAEWINNGTTQGTGRTVAPSTTERYEITTLIIVDSTATVLKVIQAGPFYIMGSQALFIQDTAAIDAIGDKVTSDVFVEEWLTAT